MRSEKEIRERIEKLKKAELNYNLFQIPELEWCLEGEPRFSVEELEKIKKWMYDNEEKIEGVTNNSFSDTDLWEDAVHVFFKIMANQNEVKKILEEKE